MCIHLAGVDHLVLWWISRLFVVKITSGSGLSQKGCAYIIVWANWCWDNNYSCFGLILFAFYSYSFICVCWCVHIFCFMCICVWTFSVFCVFVRAYFLLYVFLWIHSVRNLLALLTYHANGTVPVIPDLCDFKPGRLSGTQQGVAVSPAHIVNTWLSHFMDWNVFVDTL